MSKNPKKTFNNQAVFELFKPIVAFCKWNGNFPLQTETDWESGEFRYKFKLLSLPTLICFLYNFLILAVLLGIILGANFHFEEANELLGLKFIKSAVFPKAKASTVAKFIGGSYSFVAPTSCIMHTFFITISCIAFGNFISKWHEFEQLCQEIFPQESHNPFISLASARNKLGIAYTVFGAVPNALNILLMVIVFTSFESVRGVLIVGFVSLSTNSTIIYREYSSILMFGTLTKALKLIKSGILSTDDDKVSLANVQQWTRLLQMVRSQIQVTEKTLAANDIFSIIVNGWTYLSTFFLFYRSISNDSDMQLISIGIFLVVWIFVRIVFRAVMAEKIPREEKAIAVTLLSKAYPNQDIVTRLEIKCLVDSILISPSHIKLGNVVTLNRGLILRIITNVLSYLIVLIQFDGSSKL